MGRWGSIGVYRSGVYDMGMHTGQGFTWVIYRGGHNRMQRAAGPTFLYLALIKYMVLHYTLVDASGYR